MAEAESHRQAAIARYGIEASIKSAESRAYEYARPDASKGIYVPAAAFPSHRRAPVVPMGPMKRARMTQITHEHARLTSGRQPVNPFAVDFQDGHAFSRGQLILLQRICEKPQLVDYYLHTKFFLEETHHDFVDGTGVSAKAAMDQYYEAAEAGTCNPSSQEMQGLHNDIAQQETLSDQAKLVLLMVTFVPHGRYTTFNAMREWIHDARHMCADSHIASALKKGALLFSLEDIPMHRIVRRNGGLGNFNGRACDWGDHLPEYDDDTREAYGKKRAVGSTRMGESWVAGWSFTRLKKR